MKKLKRTWKYLTTGIVAVILVVILVAALMPVSVTITQGGFLSVGSNVALAVNNPPDWNYEPGDEFIEKRTRNSKTHWLGNGSYSLDASIGSIHYKDNPDDADEQWKDIESNIQISPKANWDWEVVKGSWHLLIREDTAVAVGKDGHWIGFRIDGCGYLDGVTKQYVSLFTRASVTPVVSANSIRWNNIFPSVDLEFIYENDRFKENVYVHQAARDWLTNHPPSDYGLSNQDSYLGIYTECDWQNTYPAEDESGNPIDWNNTYEFEGQSIFFRHPIKDYLVSALPLSWARHSDLDEEDWVSIRSRFYDDNGTKRLIFGSKVTALNQMPAGTIVFDPTYNEVIGASLDDAHEDEDDGAMWATGVTVYHYSEVSIAWRTWGGLRWTAGSFPSQGDTIDVAYIEIYVYSTTYDDANFNIHFQLSSAPAQFQPYPATYNITPRSRTSASAPWIQNSMGTGWKQSPSIVTPLQEVINSYSPTAMVIITRPNTNAYKPLRQYSWDQSSTYGAKLHIEYTAGGAEGISNTPSSKGFGILEVNTYSDTTINYFTIENTGSGAVDVVVYATDLAGGDDTWDLSDTATPGENIYGLKAGLDDDDDNFDVVVRETEAYNELVNNLLESATQDWGLRLYMPTTVTNYDGQQMASTLTLVCSAH